MCAIFGYIGHPTGTEGKMLCLAGCPRGQNGGSMDGTGLLWLNTKSEWKYSKSARSGVEFVGDSLDNQCWQSEVLLGHVRGASASLGKAGGVSDANSHPFCHGHITLAHNGMFRNWRTRVPKEKEDKFTVDSDALAYLISEKGDAAFAEVNGTAACWWLNSEFPNDIQFYCWDQDLFIWERSGDHDMLFAFASEEPMLRCAGFSKDNGKIRAVSKEGERFSVNIVDGAITSLPKIAGMKYEAAYNVGQHFSGGVGNGMGLVEFGGKRIGFHDGPNYFTSGAKYKVGDSVGWKDSKSVQRVGKVRSTVSCSNANLGDRLEIDWVDDRGITCSVIRFMNDHDLYKIITGKKKKAKRDRTDISFMQAPFPPQYGRHLITACSPVQRCPKCLRMAAMGKCHYCGAQISLMDVITPWTIDWCAECNAIIPREMEEADVGCPECKKGNSTYSDKDYMTVDLRQGCEDSLIYLVLTAGIGDSEIGKEPNAWCRAFRAALMDCDKKLFDSNYDIIYKQLVQEKK